MDDKALTALMLPTLPALLLAANVAAAYLVRDYRKRNGESELWRAFVLVCVLIVLAIDLLLPATIAANLGLPRLPYTGPLVILAFDVVLGAICWFTLRIWRVRRERSHEPVLHGPIDSPDVVVPVEEAT